MQRRKSNCKQTQRKLTDAVAQNGNVKHGTPQVPNSVCIDPNTTADTAALKILNNIV